MKHRALCCFLIALTLVVNSISFLPFNGSVVEQLFTYSWLLFAIVVIVGNGIELIPKKRRVYVKRAILEEKPRHYMRG